jgi:hypothetical protein
MKNEKKWKSVQNEWNDEQRRAWQESQNFILH